jgi:hypothetical protein
MDEKFSKSLEIPKKEKKVEMQEIKISINQIKNTVEIITNRLNHAEKEYQELKTRLRKFYIQITIMKKIKQHEYSFQEI